MLSARRIHCMNSPWLSVLFTYECGNENKYFDRIKKSWKMTLYQYKENICRICLDDNVWLDWHSKLYQFHDTTYKDCYYKYSQLERCVTDPFPQMLCKNCCNGLHNTHTLFLKALESHKILQDKFSFSRQDQEFKTSTSHNSGRAAIHCTPAEFETILVKEELIIDDHLKYDENPDEDISVICKDILEGDIQTEISRAVSANIESKIKGNQSVTMKQEFEESVKAPFRSSTSHNSGRAAIHCTPAEFETILLKEELIIDDNLKYDENPDEDISDICKDILESDIQTEISRAVSAYISSDINASSKKSKRKTTSKVKKKKTNIGNECTPIVEKEIGEEELPVEGNLIEHDLVNDNKTKEEDGTVNVKSKVKRKENPRMCSICSKILINERAVQQHEETHIENRERKETCNICGLKFYKKNNLYDHMRTHREDREKKHKCEFCSKAFFNKSDLNVHLRKHLGQMKPCSLCSKQFFRQVDLNQHMTSHSAITINSEIKKRSRYSVRCQHCDKCILSTSFKSHTAAHLKQPLMKCSICDKEFYTRSICVRHIKKNHQKTKEEYNDFIVKYSNNRLSHLFLKQKADIRPAMK